MLQHKARLWHGTFGGIYQQQRGVGHFKHALHLATKVGVAGGVDDVDFYALVFDGDIFGKNGNAALTLLIV